MPSIVIRVFQLVASLVVLALAIALALPLFALWHALPQIDGVRTAHALEAPIRIVRDGYGIPHVFAKTDRDAFFGLGYVHAQDRFTQMDFARKAGRGRLAAGLGEGALGTDRYFRTLRLDRAAEEAFVAADPDSKALLEGYAAGVNAALDADGLPWEHRLLRLSADPWLASDSVLAIKMMSLLLSGNARTEALRLNLADRLGEARLREIWPTQTKTLPGSNAWVVAGQRSASGKPLLANDPHLGFSMPPVWYLAHLSSPGMDAWGATIPGVAGIVSGRNRHVAWGLTTSYADVQDLFIETVDPKNPDSYMSPDGPRPFTVRSEIIEVRGDDPDVIQVRETRHGPVVSDHGEAYAEPAPGKVLALGWSALRESDPTYRASFGIARAGDASSLRRAISDFHSPSQNVIYAAADGTIGYVVSGRIPIRRTGDGFIPLDGSQAKNDWAGFLEGSALPGEINPLNGEVVSANQRLIPEGYEGFLSRENPPEHRAERIRDLLRNEPEAGFTAENFRDFQPDIHSRAADILVPIFLASGPFEGRAAEAASLLAVWDHSMDRDWPEPLIYSAWHRAISIRLFSKIVSEDAFGGFLSPKPRLIAGMLAGEIPGCSGEESNGCRSLIREALDEALAWIAERHGAEIARWRWGDENQASHLHSFFSGIFAVDWLLGSQRPHGGGPFTVMQMKGDWNDEDAPFARVHGPGVRLVHDLAEPARSLTVLAGGQAGNPLSRWYRDQVDAWFEGKLLVLEADPARILPSAVLLLTPGEVH